MANSVRLHKFMADAGVASRRNCEMIIATGRVQVNGKIVSTQGVMVDPENDFIKVDGKRLRPPLKMKHYYVLNKPRKVMTTLRDPQDRPTIADYIPTRPAGMRLYPVGRLDFDVAGCILLTDDGELANRLMHPKYGIPRTYEVKVNGVPESKDLDRLRRRIRRCEIEMIRDRGDKSWFHFTLFEGKYHQVKRVWMEVGFPVDKLSRLSYGGVQVRGMDRGTVRQLTPQEVEHLKELTELR